MIINNLQTYINDCGSGETILLLHGWGGNSKSFVGFINALKCDFRVITPDLWGFGQSQQPNKNTTIYDYADMVYELLRKSAVDKVHIIGHSFGGRIGIIMASKYPNIVKSLVLIASAGIKTRKSIFKRLSIWRYKLLKKKVMRGKMSCDALKNFGSTDYKTLNSDMKQVFVNIVNEDLRCYAKQITVPTILIYGKKDKETNQNIAKSLHKYIKCSKLYFIQGGHYAYLYEQDRCLKLCYDLWENIV